MREGEGGQGLRARGAGTPDLLPNSPWARPGTASGKNKHEVQEHFWPLYTEGMLWFPFPIWTQSSLNIWSPLAPILCDPVTPPTPAHILLAHYHPPCSLGVILIRYETSNSTSTIFTAPFWNPSSPGIWKNYQVLLSFLKVFWIQCFIVHFKPSPSTWTCTNTYLWWAARLVCTQSN